MADDVTVRAKALDGRWETIGVDRARGTHPENVVLQADAWGPTKAAFDLRRDPRALWPDLGAFTPVEVEADGIRVWGGRVAETPSRDASERVMSVQCDGWQYHLDDDLYERVYVHTRLSDYRDQRSFLEADLTQYRVAPQVGTDRGAITLSWPEGAQLVGGDHVGVTLDLGEVPAAYLWVDWESSSPGADFELYGRAHDTPSEYDDEVAGDISTAFTDSLSVPNGPSAGTFSTPRRYVTIFVYYSGSATTLTSQVFVKLTAARVFTDDAYRSGATSVLRASTVLRDALDRATTLLSSDWSGIEDTVFDIPEFALDGDRSPREVGTAVNALHDWLIQITPDARPIFRPKPSAPFAEIGAWAGSSFEDASANSGDEIYTHARVTGQDAANNKVRVTRSQAGTLVDRRGFQRTKALPIRSSLTTAVANQLGDIWLTGHRSTPLRGTARTTKGGVRGLPSGTDLHPAVLLLKTGELLRLADVIDPDTGGLGRDARMAGVTYRPAASEAEITLDNSRSSVEALFERLAVVTGAG